MSVRWPVCWVWIRVCLLGLCSLHYPNVCLYNVWHFIVGLDATSRHRAKMTRMVWHYSINMLLSSWWWWWCYNTIMPVCTCRQGTGWWWGDIPNHGCLRLIDIAYGDDNINVTTGNSSPSRAILNTKRVISLFDHGASFVSTANHYIHCMVLHGIRITRNCA